MKLYVPEIGDLIKLTSDWTFRLYSEWRNTNFSDSCKKHNLVNEDENVTLEEGTVLSVDRIYIRKGSSDYSSLTFYVKQHSIKDIAGKRFWAKLKDVNEIQFETFVSNEKVKKTKKNFEEDLCALLVSYINDPNNRAYFQKQVDARNKEFNDNYDEMVRKYKEKIKPWIKKTEEDTKSLRFNQYYNVTKEEYISNSIRNCMDHIPTRKDITYKEWLELANGIHQQRRNIVQFSKISQKKTKDGVEIVCSLTVEIPRFVDSKAEGFLSWFSYIVTQHDKFPICKVLVKNNEIISVTSLCNVEN